MLLKRRLSGRDIDLLPLYGGLSLEAQEKVLTRGPSSKRRVIFATNIAETSLTIEGIVGVIDSGLERVLRYDPVSDMTRLETARISKASATQRAGRAGRLRSGDSVGGSGLKRYISSWRTIRVKKCVPLISVAHCWSFFAGGSLITRQIPWLTRSASRALRCCLPKPRATGVN